MAQLKAGDTALTGVTTIEAGQGQVIIDGVKVNINKLSLPLIVDPATGIEVEGSAIVFYNANAVATTADATPSITTGAGETIAIADSGTLVIQGGSGTAIIDGVEVRLNALSYPFTVADWDDTAAGSTVELVGNSFLVHGN